MSKKSLSNSNPSTYITQIKEGSVIRGNIKSSHSIRIDGFVTGDLISEEKIIIGAAGQIGGNLSGTDISVDGQIRGDVIANGLLQLSAQSKVFGNIYAKEINMERGAELNGKIAISKEATLPSPKPSKAAVDSNMKASKGDQNEERKQIGNLAG
jgi:cytoskeletal protein CcmA (bactofilin family)